MLKANKMLTAAIVAMIALTTLIGGCKKDNPAAPAKTTYTLKARQNGVSGTITFTQTSSSVTTIDIAMTGGSGSSHPAYLRENSAAEGGTRAIDLTDVVNGKSTTTVTALNNGSMVSYPQLIAYNGYIDIRESDNDNTVIAVSDIGVNALTGESKTYKLDTVGGSGISGNIVFAKRINGDALATISTTGILNASSSYDAEIRLGSITTIGGPTQVAKTLNTVPSTGTSETNINTFDGGSGVFNYDAIIRYDGYVVIKDHSNGNLVSKGNIGTH